MGTLYFTVAIEVSLTSQAFGPPAFQDVLLLMEILFSLSCTTAVVECGFSSINLIKASTRICMRKVYSRTRSRYKCLSVVNFQTHQA